MSAKSSARPPRARSSRPRNVSGTVSGIGSPHTIRRLRSPRYTPPATRSTRRPPQASAPAGRYTDTPREEDLVSPRTVRFLALAAVLAATRAPGDQAPSVQVMVDEVDDKRTTGTFFAECDVKLKVMGDDVASALGIRAVRVVAAADDTGRDLKSDKEQGDMFFEANRDKKAVLQTTVKLANPARNAKTIRTLRGEVELFHPTAENGGIVTARDFLAKPGVPIAAPGLKAAKISLMYVTKDVLEAKKQ